MKDLVLALGPAFAAGLAVQRFLEIMDTIFNGFPKLGNSKKLVMAIASLLLAAVICSQPDIRILKYLLANQPAIQSSPSVKDQQAATPIPAPDKDQSQKQSSTPVNNIVDFLITMLFISGGTEGLNALLKFLNYKKENAKGDAANTQSDADQKKIKGKDALTVVRGT